MSQGNRIIIGLYANAEYCNLMVNAVLSRYNIYHESETNTHTLESFNPEDFLKAKKLYAFIDNAYGVKDVTIRRFEVGVTKGEAFDWCDVIPPIIKHLKEYILIQYPELSANPWNVSILDERERYRNSDEFGRKKGDELSPVTLEFFGINATGDQIA